MDFLAFMIYFLAIIMAAQISVFARCRGHFARLPPTQEGGPYRGVQAENGGRWGVGPFTAEAAAARNGISRAWQRVRCGRCQGVTYPFHEKILHET